MGCLRCPGALLYPSQRALGMHLCKAPPPALLTLLSSTLLSEESLPLQPAGGGWCSELPGKLPETEPIPSLLSLPRNWLPRPGKPAESWTFSFWKHLPSGEEEESRVIHQSIRKEEAFGPQGLGAGPAWRGRMSLQVS